jgi:hypothetical protein
MEAVKDSVVCRPALGYMRLAPDISEQSARRLRDELAASAEREGYTLGEVFIERDTGGSSAFATLIDALTQTKTPVVVVPGMCHFAHLPGLRTAMKDHLERETGARVVMAHVADDAELIVSELMTNALKAAGQQTDIQPITLHLLANDDYLMIQVWDALSTAPAPRPHTIDAETGRGLEIVTLLSDRWGFYRPAGGGKVVWATLVTGTAPSTPHGAGT